VAVTDGPARPDLHADGVADEERLVPVRHLDLRRHVRRGGAGRRHLGEGRGRRDRDGRRHEQAGGDGEPFHLDTSGLVWWSLS
jgi:hypothetical protein